MSAARFDVVVVGGGTAGLTAALAARHEGASVALVERDDRLGGDCTYFGCVPSKALIEVARSVRETKALVEAGVLIGQPRLDDRSVVKRLRRIVSEIAADERLNRFTSAGIDVVQGDARFVGPSLLEVGSRTLRGSRFVIATGSSTEVPPIPGLAEVPYLTNRTIFDLDALPERLLVVGAGPIGLELAQAYARLGCAVTVVEQLAHVLPAHDVEVGVLVERALRNDGVDLLLGRRVGRLSRVGRRIAVDVEHSAPGEVVVDAVLLATGRVGSTDGLGLGAVGIETDRGFVRIDRRCATDAGNVFAAGDVTGGLNFTHVAAHEGQVAGRNAAGGRATRDLRVTPSVVFVDPEVATVGLSEREARARFGAEGVRVASFPMDRVDRARISGETNGFVKLITARRRLLGWAGGGRLLGAVIVGRAAGELIHECALAMQVGAFTGRLAQTIHAYPTSSMAVQQAASQLFPLGRALVESAPGLESPSGA